MVDPIVVGTGTKLLENYGIINGLFVILVLSLLYVSIKYIPIAFKAHFNAIDDLQLKHNSYSLEMQKKFSDNLDDISKKYLDSIGKISEEHEKQMEKLIDIHNDIKILHNKN